MLRAGPLGSGTSLLALVLLARISAGQPAETRSIEAQPSAREGASELKRPVPRGDFQVPYPGGETREAAVVLELVVDRAGAVSEARVVEGEPPFADAALRAAKNFQFEPARRGGEPVVARIRVQVRFVPPKLASEPEPATPNPEPRTDAQRKPGPARSTAPRIEILVEGERAPPGRMTLGRTEVRELPGAFGDPFRAVEVFPGVTPIFTGVPFFYVRGSPPGNVGYFLDGIRVPLLFHVALGPSVIHPGLVDHVDIYPGGYPARYGRFGGAVVAAETTTPRRELRGEANVRLFDAGALMEAPIAGGRGNVLVGGRYSYTAAMLSLFAPEVSLQYWDYQARASFDLDARWRVGALVFGAYDLFQSDDDDASVGTQFHRVDLRAEHTPDPATRLRVAATIGLDRSAAEDPSSADDSDSAILDDRLAGVRFELERRVSPGLLVRAGADVNFDDYRISEVEIGDEDDPSSNEPEIFYSRNDFTSGLRGDLVWEPERGVVITPGVRADLYWSGAHGVVAFEPRIAAEFAVSRALTLAHTFGIAHQAPSFVVPIPGLVLSDLRDGLQRSLQSSAGVAVRPGGNVQLSVTLFHNVFLNLTDFLGTWTLRERAFSQQQDERLDIRSMGQAYGLELLVKRPFSQRFSGYLAYTLSRSTRSLSGDHAVANFDRTHVVHAAVSYDLGRNWRSGARFSAYSGVPPQHDYTDLDSDPLSILVVPAQRRSPPFWRLDLRLEKRWLIDRRGRYWAFVIEMLNSTLNREVPFLECGADGCEGEPVGPVTIPSIGAEVFF